MQKKEILLNRISNFLMLHASFIDNYGLLQGKLGIAIFFYRYAEYKQKKYYSDYADEIIDEIYSDIHKGYPYNFIDGLCGIGWGIEYIIRNKYVNVDSNEILKDLDFQIFNLNLNQVNNVSLETGLEGIAHYILGRSVNNFTLPTSKKYLTSLISSMQNKGNIELINDLLNLVHDLPINYSFNLLDNLANKSEYKPDLFIKHNIGIINNGLTGIAIQLLNQLTI